MDDQTPPQSRAEVNFVCFSDELLVKVVVTNFGDADAANSHFFGIFQALLLLLYLSASRTAADTELQAPAEDESGEGFGSASGTPCSQVPHLKSSANRAKVMLAFMG